MGATLLCRCAGKTGRRRVTLLMTPPHPDRSSRCDAPHAPLSRRRRDRHRQPVPPAGRSARTGGSCRAGAGRSCGRRCGSSRASWSSSRPCCSSSRSRSTWRRTTTPRLLPTWIRTGSADAERQVLIAIAAAVITVVGVVFSITILALTLASQQFGPRMMRNFVRDIGNQVTLGVFVGTFVYRRARARSPSAVSARDSSRTCPPRWPRPSCWSTSASSSTSSTTSPSPSSCPR